MTQTKLSRTINLGYVQLTDSAPLLMAKKLGFFERYGLDVCLHPQPSWSTLRDRLDAGILDAAQLLAPMPLANQLGLSGSQQALLAPIILSQNGNGLTLSNALIEEIKTCNGLSQIDFPLSASFLKAVIAQRKAKGLKPLTLASVFHYSCHRYQVLDWLSEGGVALGDICLVITPPAMMAESLESGVIDGFCAGGPYNAKSVREKRGQTVLTSFDIWEDKLEKVLGVTHGFYHKHSDTVLSLCASILDACEWLRNIPNRFEAARYLAQPDVLNQRLDVIAPSLLGSCLTFCHGEPRHIPHYNRFSSLFSSHSEGRYAVNNPTQEQAQWLLTKMCTYDQFPQLSKSQSEEVAQSAFRSDIFAQVLMLRQQQR
jgi:NitT/TauT family transport system ATP-binding protein/nitrate/nitrite transport system substrate-binding protein